MSLAEERRSHLARALRTFCVAQGGASSPPMADLDEETHQWMVKWHLEREDSRKQLDSSLLVIPTFWKKTNKKSEAFQLTKDIAQSVFKARWDAQILTEDEMDAIYNDVFQMTNNCPHTRKLTYEQFCRLRELLPEQKRKAFFAPTIFMRFPRDEDGTIDASSFLQYMFRKVTFMTWRSELSVFDTGSKGYLTHEELYRMLRTFTLENNPALMEEVPPDNVAAYLTIGVVKILFFLDPAGHGRVSIKELIFSEVYLELMEIVRSEHPEEQSSNWFSAANTIRLIGHFEELDSDGDGLLTLEDLLPFNGCAMTTLFLSRVMEILHVPNSMMDLENFVKLVLMIEVRDTKESMFLHFQLLDLDNRGYLTIGNLNAFFREIAMREEYVEQKEDVLGELFDMIAPRDPLKITMEDLLQSGNGSRFVGILTDVKAFMSYETRESMSGEDAEQEW